MRAEDQKMFGIFVGLLNRQVGSEFTVKEAAASKELVDLFEAVSIDIKGAYKHFGSRLPVHKMSTRKRSLNMLSAEVDLDVLNVIRDVPGLSRWDYAQRTMLRVSTVCGAVARLIALDKVKVSGKKIDPNTGRPVETLEPMS